MALLQGFPVVVLTVTTLAACAATKGSAAISPRAKLLNPFHTKRLSMMSPCIYVVQLRSRLIRPGVARGAMSGECSRPPATIKTGKQQPKQRSSGACSRRIHLLNFSHVKIRVPISGRGRGGGRGGGGGRPAGRADGGH